MLRWLALTAETVFKRLTKKLSCTSNLEPMTDAYPLLGGISLSHVGTTMISSNKLGSSCVTVFSSAIANSRMTGCMESSWACRPTATGGKAFPSSAGLSSGWHRDVLCSGIKRLENLGGKQGNPLGEEVSAKFRPRGPEEGRVQSPNQRGLHPSPFNRDHCSSCYGQRFNWKIKTQKASFMRVQTNKS